jgi:hypothetical protein
VLLNDDPASVDAVEEMFEARDCTERLVKNPNVLAKIFPAGGEMVRKPLRFCQASGNAEPTKHRQTPLRDDRLSIERGLSTEETPPPRCTLDRIEAARR